MRLLWFTNRKGKLVVAENAVYVMYDGKRKVVSTK